jgi:hypothetical protein
MKIKNKHASAIGFGSVTVLPDAIGELPREFTVNHPMLKYYISRGWVEAVYDTSSEPETPQPVSVSIEPSGSGESGSEDGVGGNDDNKDSDSGEDDKSSEPAKNTDKPTPISQMKLDELRALAGELGLAFTEADTRQTLIDMIKAAKRA